MSVNENAPFGFRYTGNFGGGSAMVREYVHAAADGVAIGKGDHVITTGALDTVAQSAAAGPHLGSSLAYTAASVLANIPVVIAAYDTLFEVQEDGNTGTASEGLNANGVTALAPNAATGISKEQISSTTANTTNTLAWRLFAVSPRIGNDGTTSNAKWLVFCNIKNTSNQVAGI